MTNPDYDPIDSSLYSEGVSESTRLVVFFPTALRYLKLDGSGYFIPTAHNEDQAYPFADSEASIKYIRQVLDKVRVMGDLPEGDTELHRIHLVATKTITVLQPEGQTSNEQNPDQPDPAN